MCVTDLDPDLDITENGHGHPAEGRYAGVAWGQWDQAGQQAGHQAGHQDDPDPEEAGIARSAH